MQTCAPTTTSRRPHRGRNVRVRVNQDSHVTQFCLKTKTCAEEKATNRAGDEGGVFGDRCRRSGERPSLVERSVPPTHNPHHSITAIVTPHPVHKTLLLVIPASPRFSNPLPPPHQSSACVACHRQKSDKANSHPTHSRKYSCPPPTKATLSRHHTSSILLLPALNHPHAHKLLRINHAHPASETKLHHRQEREH